MSLTDIQIAAHNVIGGPFGLGCGNIYYMVTAKTTANLYYQKLIEDGISEGDIFTSLATAYAATTGNQNDVIVATPGAYLETAELAWSNANTHLVGLSGPNTGGDWSEPGVVIYTTGTGVASVITVTGANCRFYNVAILNYGNHAACLTALHLNTYGCYFKNVSFQGHMTANQNTTVAAASLYIGGAGMYPIFEDCQIGQDVWGTRSAINSGVLRFVSAGRPNGATFRRCKFLSRSVTATCAMVAVPVNTYIGRSWFFDNCHFSNFYDGTTELNQVFYTVTGTQQKTIQLHNCSNVGFAAWQTGAFNVVYGDMPVAAITGGEMIQPT